MIVVMYMLELKDRSWLKKHKLSVSFFYSQQSMCFLSVIQLTLSIIGYWTTIYLVSYEWKWRSYIWLRILKYYTNVCNCKVCHEKYFKCLKIQLFFHGVWKGCMISVRFTILLCVLFFFSGEITMVETGPVLVFQDYCPGLKKIR